VINAYWQKSNLAYAAAAATVMLLMTFGLFFPLALFSAWRQRVAA